MVFELGKFYRHSGGESMHMIAETDLSIMYLGPTILSEDTNGNLKACGIDEVSAQNWVEISESEYTKGYHNGT